MSGGSLEREFSGAWALWSGNSLERGLLFCAGGGSLGRGLFGAGALWSGTLFCANFALFEIDLDSSNDRKKFALVIFFCLVMHERKHAL